MCSAAQERLSKASALIIGAGGLGCPCALHLVASGIGTLGIADKDTVSLDNLHRQIAHAHGRVGAHKCDSAAEACRQLRPDAALRLFRDGLTPANAEEICRQFDVVVDCSDNAPTRYVVNDASVAAGRPLVSGAAVGLDGQLTVYNHGGGPCYRCAARCLHWQEAVWGRCNSVGSKMSSCGLACRVQVIVPCQ